MKQYTVFFSEPVAHTYKDERFNKTTLKWEEVEITEMEKSYTFFTLTTAKKLIKNNLDKYAGSSITKTFANGDSENLGEIKLNGSNKTFVANTKQDVSNY
mgnify:CR=1 FL=1